MGGLEVADLVALKGGWHGSRTRIEVPVRVGGADLFGFLYFAQIVAWIVQNTFPGTSIAHVIVEEVKRVSGSCIQPQQESILKQLSGLGQQCLEASAPVLEPGGDMEVMDGGQVGATIVIRWVATSFLALALRAVASTTARPRAPGWC
jgi:hypothetical protein